MSKFWKMHDEFVSEWEWWNVYPHHPLFEWLLTKAKVKDCRVRGVMVRRGSVLTTWEEMRKAVSNKYKTCSVGSLSRALKDLQDAREITLKTERRNTIVTICKYGNYFGYNDDIWSDSGVIAERKRSDTPIINKNKEYENNIYSACESLDDDDGFVTEADCRLWMRRYAEIARSFGVADKDLPRQLSARRIQRIQLCVREMGRGTVDAMFARLAESAGYFDQGSRGWKGDFTNLWSPSVFDKVLEGSFVPVAKKKEAQARPRQGQESVGAYEYKPEPARDRKAMLEAMVASVRENPRSFRLPALVAAYESGELAELGIDWKPNNE